MEGFCGIEGLVGTSKQLDAAIHVCVVGLPQSQANQVGFRGCAGSHCHGRPRSRPLLLTHIFLHQICIFHFFAVVMHVPRPITSRVPPHPKFIDTRRRFGNKISIGLCSFFLCAQSITACSGDFHRALVVKNPSSFPLFLGEAFGKCIGGSHAPTIWDSSWTSELESQSLRGI